MPRTVATDPWVLRYEGFDPEKEGLREALCALGNGVFVTRGAAEEAEADGVHYPGTYLAGGYNRLESEVSGRTVVNEDLVNFPNWLPLTFRPEGGPWLDRHAVDVVDYRQELHLREGVLLRRFRVRDPEGRETTVETRRIVHMRTPHFAGIEYRITPENWSGAVHLRSSLDGSVRNSGVARYRELSSQHLEVSETGACAPEGIVLLARTSQSRLEVAVAARLRVFADDERRDGERILLQHDPNRIGEEVRSTVREGETLRAEKIVALYASRHRGITEPGFDARLALGRAGDFDALLRTHRLAWEALWRRCDVELEGTAPSGEPLNREQLILRLHVFHLLQTVSPNTVGLDVGVPARGLHGEAYRGHIFWDEAFIFPAYNAWFPQLTRSLLLYRYHRLEAARELAAAEGYAGAVFPWQSSSDGREATQEMHLNPLSGRWDPDHSHLQRHVSAAIVHNVWQYYRATGDRVFLQTYGAEILLDVARFWSSIATENEARGRFEIVGVMGPDEYHEKLPGAESGGLPNNAYTNVMAVWCLLRALEVLDLVGESRREELLALLGIGAGELERWEALTRRMFIPFHDGVISQFEGYERLEELDWDAVRARHDSIERLDRILKSEGDSPDRYKLSKQADVGMLFYLLSRDELGDLFERLGYRFDEELVRRTVEYYASRTSHGSTLSRVVYASTVLPLDCDEGCRLFLEALRSDVDDLQGGTTAEGIHLGAMAGTLGMVIRHFAGVRLGPAGVSFDPDLPGHFRRLAFRVHWHGRWLDVELDPEALRITLDRDVDESVPVRVGGARDRVEPGTSRHFALRGGRVEATAGSRGDRGKSGDAR